MIHNQATHLSGRSPLPIIDLSFKCQTLNTTLSCPWNTLMPTVTVDKQLLFEALEKQYSEFHFILLQKSLYSMLWNNFIFLFFLIFIFFFYWNWHFDNFINLSASEEFDELCFRFGIELEEDVCLAFVYWRKLYWDSYTFLFYIIRLRKRMNRKRFPVNVHNWRLISQPTGYY